MKLHTLLPAFAGSLLLLLSGCAVPGEVLIPDVLDIAVGEEGRTHRRG